VAKAKVLKIPYILVVGDDDVESGTVGVNRRGSNQPERGVEVTAFTESLEGEIAERRLPESR
jgi:threonyl-tRNA synthetase